MIVFGRTHKFHRFVIPVIAIDMLHHLAVICLQRQERLRGVSAHRESLIMQPSTTFEFVVSEKPTRAAIDLYSKLIDRNLEDNWANVG